MNSTESNKPVKRLNGRVAVVTGASSGTGRAIALELARQGATLVLAARREAALKEVADLCADQGARATHVVTDVTDAAAVKALAAAAARFGGRVDVWVNNAGVLAAGTFEDTPVEVHDGVVRTNLLGYLHGAHAVLPYFKQQRSGILINNISVGGWFPTPYGVGYTASKFGLRGLSEALRGELTSWPGIHICDLFPAFLDTPGIQHAANYTGRYLKPAPPVYDPQRVAQAVAALIQQPRKSVTVGSAATFLRVAHAVAPGLSRLVTAKMVEGYLKNAAPLAASAGNVLAPVAFGTGIHGGWNTQADADKRKKTGALLLTGLLVCLVLLRRF